MRNARRARVLATIARLAAVARARVDAARTSCDARSACQVQQCRDDKLTRIKATIN